jgi:hypothetical protein
MMILDLCIVRNTMAHRHHILENEEANPESVGQGAQHPTTHRRCLPSCSQVVRKEIMKRSAAHAVTLQCHYLFIDK